MRKNAQSERKMYVHYGANSFDKSKFKKVRNRENWFKPIGGLWGSPVNAEYGWKQWCLDNKYCEIKEDNCFYFRIRGNQVYEIETIDDLQRLPHKKVSKHYKEFFSESDGFLDFDTITTGELYYSALDIKIKEVEEALMGYDCDCILVLDDRDLVINYDAKTSNNPLILNDLLPLKWHKTIESGIEVCGLLQMPGDKVYVYCEQPDDYYCLKCFVACITDGRIVETLGFTENEAKRILKEISLNKEEIEQFVKSNRK